MTEPLAIEFANTWYAVRGRELEGVGSPAELTAWLSRHADALGIDLDGSQPDADVSDDEVAVFLALRDAVRALLRSVAEHGPATAADVSTVNEASAATRRWPVLAVDGDAFAITEASDRAGTLGARAAIARDAIRILGGPLHDDVRACHAPGCVQFFVKDHPRREWCSAGCGNRARAARHYRKQRED
jgi:predicted RNA-binding Zn ribbon-like protein